MKLYLVSSNDCAIFISKTKKGAQTFIEKYCKEFCEKNQYMKPVFKPHSNGMGGSITPHLLGYGRVQYIHTQLVKSDVPYPGRKR